MNEEMKDHRPGTLDWLALHEVVKAAASEARRRELHEFDGLLGRLPRDSATLLQRTLGRIRDYLIDTYGEDNARAAVQAHLTPRGFRASSAAETVLLDIFTDIAIATAPHMVEPGTHEEVAAAEDAGLDREALLFGKTGRAARRGRRAGGKSTGEAASIKADARHAKWCEEGRKLLQSGKAPYQIAGILAERWQVSARTVRMVLVREGIIPGRKKTDIS